MDLKCFLQSLFILLGDIETVVGQEGGAILHCTTVAGLDVE